MTTAAALILALLSISVLVAVLGVAIVVARAARRRGSARRARLTAPVRPQLLALVAEDDPMERERIVMSLLDLDDRTWRALEATVGGLLGKLRGDAHGALRGLLERRGTVRRARARVNRPGAVGRARAAEVLGSLEDPAVTADLIGLLRDRDPEVRQVAARALGRCGDSRAAAPLLRCVAGGSVPPRVVSQALLRLGSSAQPALVEALREQDELVRAVAVEILGLSSAVSASRAVELCLLQDESVEVRIRAARALGRVGMPSALAALLPATHSDSPVPLRAVAARALGELGHPGAVTRLRELLDDPIHRVAVNAARSLSVLGPVGIDVLEEEVGSRQGTRSAAHAGEALARTQLRRRAAAAEGDQGTGRLNVGA